jgi:hypothetical protein
MRGGISEGIFIRYGFHGAVRRQGFVISRW